MNKTIKLSLVAFMLLSTNVINADTNLNNNIVTLADTIINVNSGTHNAVATDGSVKTIINHTNGTLNLNQNYSNMQITSIAGTTNITGATINNSALDFNNRVEFDKINIFNNVNLQGNRNNSGFNYLLKDTSTTTFDNSSISDIKFEPWSDANEKGTLIIKNSTIHDSQLGLNKRYIPNLILNSAILDKTSDNKTSSIFSKKLDIINSSILDTNINIKTSVNIDSSYIEGEKITLEDNASIAIKNNSVVNSEIVFGANNSLTINNANYEIKKDLDLANLTLNSATTNKNFTISNSINLDNSTLNGTNVTLKDNASISIKNNSVINSEIVFGANNSLTIDNANYEIKKDLDLANLTLNFAKTDKNFTISNSINLDNSTLNGTSVTLKDNASIAIKNNSIINSEIIFGNNNNLTIDNANYEIKKDLILNNLTLKNYTLIGDIQNKHNIVANSGMQLNKTNIENAILTLNPGVKKYIQFSGENNLKNVSIKNTNPLELNQHHITLNTNDTILNIENSEIENSSINTWTAQLKESKLVIKNSKLINTGIGNVSPSENMYVRIPFVEFENVEYVNEIIGNGIFAKELSVNGGYIKTDKIYGANIIDFGNHGIATRDETSIIVKNGAIIESNIDVEKFVIENSTLTGNIEVIKDAAISNTQVKSDIITANDLTINNQTSSFIANNINIVNSLGINNSSNIQGSFKVGNDFNINNSTILGNIDEVKNLNLTNSTLTGDINTTSNNLVLTDSKIITDKLISASNDITITNTTKQTNSVNFSAGNNFTSTNTEFSGNITANNLLSDNNSTFKGEVVADSINAVGSTFENTLTITGNSKNNILDNATLIQGINVNSKDASISIVNGSNIQGAIKNEGTIIVDKNSTISNEVSGSGKLNTDSATYNDNVSMGSIEGSGNTFIKDVEVTNKDSVLNVGDNTFGGNIKVENGTIMADSSFNLKDLTASNINIKNEDVNTKDKINTNNVSVSDKLFIENIDVKANQISAKQAEIVNSNVTSEIFLKGNDDKATSVYDKAEITSGNYTINNSAIKGGIRVDSLSVNNSNIVGQLAVNKLNATNSTFYITGGGYNTSLYEHFSGAIIAKEGASGGNNTINISNTNIGKLINGYVPVAIINNKTPNAIRADILAASPKIVEQEYFKVTYTTPISTIFLSPSVVHYNKIDDGTSIKEIWSVGLAGKELSESEVIDIINGKGNANYSTTQAVDKNYKDYIMSEVFDNATKKELNSIIYNPYFVAKNNLDILNDRYTYLRTDNKNHGFWLDNNYSYNFYNDIKLKNKGISVGVDNFIDLDKLSVSYGAFTNASRLSLDNAKIDTKLIGAYASTNFYNGVFVDYSLAYASLKHKFDAKKLEFNNTYYTNLWQASIKAGHRLGTTSYIEPSLEINATRFQKHNVKTKNVQITANQGTLVSLKTGVKAGVDLNKNFSLKTELAYYNDLNKSPKANVVSMLESDFSGIRDYGLNAKLGLLVKPSNKLDINADIAKKISLTNESNYKVNLGFNYKF